MEQAVEQAVGQAVEACSRVEGHFSSIMDGYNGRPFSSFSDRCRFFIDFFDKWGGYALETTIVVQDGISESDQKRLSDLLSKSIDGDNVLWYLESGFW